jgi:hypothetical protein
LILDFLIPWNTSLLPNSTHIFIVHIWSNPCHVEFLIGCVFSNGVMINDWRCHDETESILWTTATWLCCLACAGIMVSNHDLLQSYTDVLSPRDLVLIYTSMFGKKIYISDQKQSDFLLKLHRG